MLCIQVDADLGLMQVREEEDWVCSMHPFSSMRSCTIPEDTVMVKAFQGDHCTIQTPRPAALLMLAQAKTRRLHRV